MGHFVAEKGHGVRKEGEREEQRIWSDDREGTGIRRQTENLWPTVLKFSLKIANSTNYLKFVTIPRNSLLHILMNAVLNCDFASLELAFCI